jgi:hypothetical protein
MRRLASRGLVCAATAGMFSVVAPGAPAGAGGPVTALGNICEHVDGGEWTAATLRCFRGPDRGISRPARVVCEKAIGGEMFEWATFDPRDGSLGYGWECDPS